MEATNTSTKKVYVLDTSILIENPNIVNELRGDIVIPRTVIRQLDRIKTEPDTDRAIQSRKATSILDRITATGNVLAGIKLPNGSILRLVNNYATVDDLDNAADNKILGTAVKIKRTVQNATTTITLLATDKNMRIAARVYGIEAEEYRKETEKKGKIVYNNYRTTRGKTKGLLFSFIKFSGLTISIATLLLIIVMIGGNEAMSTFLFYGVAFAAFYLLIIRPINKKYKDSTPPSLREFGKLKNGEPMEHKTMDMTGFSINDPNNFKH